MFLVVVGDFDEKKIKAQLNGSFGSWHSKESLPDYSSVVVPTISNPESQNLHCYLPEDQMIFGGARLIPTMEDAEYLCLMLLADYVNSLLFGVREQTGLFYTAQAFLTHGSTDRRKGMCGFVTQVSCNNFEAAQQVLVDLFRTIAQRGMTERDLKIAKKTVQNSLAKSFGTNSSLAGSYSSLTSDGKDFDYYQKRLDQGLAITLEQVNAVAAKYLNPDEWTLCSVGRESLG